VFRRRCRVSVHPLAPVCNQMSLVGELGELSTCCTLKLYLATKYTFTEKLKEGAEGLWRPFGYLRSALNRRFPYWSLEDQLDRADAGSWQSKSPTAKPCPLRAEAAACPWRSKSPSRPGPPAAFAICEFASSSSPS